MTYSHQQLLRLCALVRYHILNYLGIEQLSCFKCTIDVEDEDEITCAIKPCSSPAACSNMQDTLPPSPELIVDKPKLKELLFFTVQVLVNCDKRAFFIVFYLLCKIPSVSPNCFFFFEARQVKNY